MSLAGLSEIPVIAAFSLGLLMAISPCPLATNIAAMAYITQRVSSRWYAVITSALYTLGRMLAYSVIGILIIIVGFQIPGTASFLQNTGEMILGPVLIVVGIVLLNIERFRFGNNASFSSLGEKMSRWGMVGGFLLGVIFALSFCPYSAVLYFGVLIPLALKSADGLVLPAIFAIGTGLPVLIFGILLSFGVSRVSTWFERLTKAQKTIRIVTASVLIGIGIYYVVLFLQN